MGNEFKKLKFNKCQNIINDEINKLFLVQSAYKKIIKERHDSNKYCSTIDIAKSISRPDPIKIKNTADDKKSKFSKLKMYFFVSMWRSSILLCSPK
jgi:hypothetical protein